MSARAFLGTCATVFFMCALSSAVSAACTFATHTYRDALADPSNIEHIGVEIKKSRKWVKNGISIITSRKANIDAKYKETMKATLRVEYAFGTCEYDARVRQSGDWKDHIRVMPNGSHIISSIDVKLKEGNVLNAVRFKLLLPETRGGLNEVLATHVLRGLGYIAPETFMVSADINGARMEMLFQENAEKELLERNTRREGPILEGDESILWNIDGFVPLQLENVSAARTSNDKWAAKGATSMKIALAAHRRLQAAYLDYANQGVEQPGASFEINLVPNLGATQHGFETYGVLVLAMNGEHALRPHNRKYYFNSFTQSFEPIYYDGNVSFLAPVYSSNKPGVQRAREFFLAHASAQALEAATDTLANMRQSQTFRDGFLKRAGTDTAQAAQLFDAGLAAMAQNLRGYRAEAANSTPALHPKEPSDFATLRTGFVSRLGGHGLDSDYIEALSPNADGSYSGQLVRADGTRTVLELTPEDLTGLIGDNDYRGQRVVLLADPAEATTSAYPTLPFLGGSVVLSKGASVDIDTDARRMHVTQTRADDWVLVRDVTLEGWDITFEGQPQDPAAVSAQRFNDYGLTGCLNFYNVDFTDTAISGTDGQCEDTINIVSSQGHLKTLSVQDGFADAIDIDFAAVSIDALNVTRTGNDCFDVSTGQFIITSAHLLACGDKGISVGERSDLNAQDVHVQDAAIGVSSKDLSQARIARFTGDAVAICAEAFQKKQEFGGGILVMDNFQCDGEVNSDAASDIRLNVLSQ